MITTQLHHGDCREILPTLETGSVDAVITDPPYPEIDRPYGKLTEAEWWDMMMIVCRETMRILKPTGSAVFILQPNSRKNGSMRGWIFEFLAWICREWNMVQDVWWWNYTAIPCGSGVHRDVGLLKMSVKSCAWAGPSECYRNQDAVLWAPSKTTQSIVHEQRLTNDIKYFPSGMQVRRKRINETPITRGGSVPFNLLPIENSNSNTSSGVYGHSAGTPLKLADWWTRYIVPPGGVVLDMFNGAGTMGVAAVQRGCSYIGIEKESAYLDMTRDRLSHANIGLGL